MQHDLSQGLTLAVGHHRMKFGAEIPNNEQIRGVITNVRHYPSKFVDDKGQPKLATNISIKVESALYNQQIAGLIIDVPTPTDLWEKMENNRVGINDTVCIGYEGKVGNKHSIKLNYSKAENSQFVERPAQAPMAPGSAIPAEYANLTPQSPLPAPAPQIPQAPMPAPTSASFPAAPAPQIPQAPMPCLLYTSPSPRDS